MASTGFNTSVITLRLFFKSDTSINLEGMFQIIQQSLLIAFDLEDFIVVADSGLMNKTNISLLESGGYKYIIGANIKSETEEIKQWIPGVQPFSAMCILAEIGNDMSAFQKANHLVGWAGLRPRNEETAEKIKSRKILHGNKYLRQILVEISWSAARSNKSFLGKKFNILSLCMKSQKALIAITRKMLVNA